MSDSSECSSENVAPLLRLGLDEFQETQMADPDATIMAPAPRPRTGGSPSLSPRGWEPPNVEQLQKLLPQYEISAFIARGGMGAVYKGRQRTLKRPVAIKVLPPDLEDGDLQFAARFKHEAQAMAQLSHPNIVAVFDAGETPDGLLYFVMEFIEGTDVAQLIASERQLDPLRAIQITTAVCEALAFAHEEGIIHRDIKPSNIMLDKRGRVKVADFGLAKTVNLEHSLQTQSNMAMGTPDFIAPEALMPGMKVDGRADIYAVGVMLYQMLTGHIPRGRFELPSGVVPQVNKGLDAVVDKAMQTDREKRYSTAMEMKTAVEKVGSGHSKKGGAKQAEMDKPRSREANAPAPLPSAQTKRRALIIAVVVVGVVAFFALRKPVTSAGAEAVKPVGNAADAAALPQRGWTKVWQKREDIPVQMAVKDGWVTTKEGQLGIRVPALSGKNGGVRARFRWGPDRTHAPQLQLRNTGGVGYNIIPAYNAVIFRRNGAAASGGSVELKKMPLTLPKAGQEYVLEFIAVGQTLIARLDDQTVSMQLDAGDYADLRGEAGLFQTDVNAFRDVEVINLDGLPEAEALRLAGISEPTEGGKWQDLIPLIDPAKHTINGNWTVQNGTLVCKAAPWALCELPIDYHGGSYDLRFSFTRGEGERLAMYFPFRKGETAGDVVFDYFNHFTDGMKRAGLENISGHRLGDAGSICRFLPEWIPPGRKSTVLLQVREGGIVASLNGAEVFRWQADWTQLHQQGGFEKDAFAKLDGRPIFGVGLFSCDAIYHSIEMREVTGSAGRNLPPAPPPNPEARPSSANEPAGRVR